MNHFSIIVAVDQNQGIGLKGDLPWHLPGDLKRFKEITTAVASADKKNAVIMGRKTWESLPSKFRPLPNRINLVLSRQINFSLPENVLRAENLNQALQLLSGNDGKDKIENIFVIGGAQIFAEAIDHKNCQKIYVTEVLADYHCDVFFPSIPAEFIPIKRSETHREGEVSYCFIEYARR